MSGHMSPAEGAAHPSAGDVATRFFVALSENDMATVDALYDPGFELWHSFDNRIRGRAECLGMVRSLGRVARKNYHLVESLETGNRVCQRYRLTLNAEGVWNDRQVDIVIFATVVGGMIVRMDEYLDSRDADEVIAAVAKRDVDHVSMHSATLG